MPDYTSTAPARLATRLAFFASGFAMASCAPLFPFIKANVNADEGQFGIVLLCLGLGSLIAMPVTGAIAARFGARLMILLGGFGLVVFLPLLTLAGSQFLLGAALFGFGASLGTIDVAMNVHGADIEKREDRSLMSGFHAQFSIGGFFGAALMTVILSTGASFVSAAIIGAVVTLIAMTFSRSRLLATRSGDPEPFSFPHGIVLLLATLAAVSFLVEGAILDWGALLLIERDLTTTQNAGVGYILFSIAMIVARLSGDKCVAALGQFWVLVLGGLSAMIGVVLVLTSSWPFVALIGFMLVGLGAANLVPIVFSAAGRQNIMPAGLAVASVTTTGYAGILIGPALIGFTADATGLPMAFGVLAILLIIFPLTARIVARI